MSLGKVLGLEPGDAGPTRRLGAVIGLLSLGDFLVEGAVLSTFLARVGAEHLPAALAARAVVEVLVSLGYARMARRLAPGPSLSRLIGAAALALTLLALGLGTLPGVLAAFVVASSIARVKVIHFGVLALAELSGGAATRALPVVYACARVGAIAAGPLLALAAGLGTRSALVIGALAYAAATVVLVRRGSGDAAPSSPPPSLAFEDEPVPSTSLGRGSAAGSLLGAIAMGAVALAVGRLVLTTQSGAILEARFGEQELARVFGMYFAAANLVGLVIQLLVVGRVLRAGGLPILNTAWSALYVAAQLTLAFGPPLVATALGARLVESELRNAARTPVANLLYEGLPAHRRAAARTLVIGVAIPLASLAAGGVLALSSKSHALLSTVGVSAAVVLLLATLAQNRAWKGGR